MCEILSGILFWLFFCAATALGEGGETNSLTNPSTPSVRHGAASPKKLAAKHEQAGRKREAAAVYEEIARTDPAARKILSHRLVSIYIETGETNKALTWAHEVMLDNPDPQAYLAGVHARLGQFERAQEILEKEIASNTNTTRAVTLRWQLAEVFEEMGNTINTRKILNEAVTAAKGTPMESVARQRLKGLNPKAKPGSHSLK